MEGYSAKDYKKYLLVEATEPNVNAVHVVGIAKYGVTEADFIAHAEITTKSNAKPENT